MTRNSFFIIDSSIDEMVKLRDGFDVWDKNKELRSIKTTRRNDMNPITKIINKVI